MKLAPCAPERYQSIHEHQVEINLSESGVDPLSVGDLLDAAVGFGGPPDAPREGLRPLDNLLAALPRAAAATRPHA